MGEFSPFSYLTLKTESGNNDKQEIIENSPESSYSGLIIREQCFSYVNCLNIKIEDTQNQAKFFISKSDSPEYDKSELEKKIISNSYEKSCSPKRGDGNLALDNEFCHIDSKDVKLEKDAPKLSNLIDNVAVEFGRNLV